MAYEGLGRYPEAIADMEAVLSASPGEASILGSLGHVFAMAHREEDARRVLSELLAQTDPDYASFFIALVYAGLGETEEALTWLERAVDARSGSVRYLKMETRLAGLRDEPRYRRLMERVGLSE
jgi:tetratricopeptide (TPR) repeat protein